jgi:hypothetical protein
LLRKSEWTLKAGCRHLITIANRWLSAGGRECANGFRFGEDFSEVFLQRGCRNRVKGIAERKTQYVETRNHEARQGPAFLHCNVMAQGIKLPLTIFDGPMCRFLDFGGRILGTRGSALRDDAADQPTDVPR